MEDSTMTAVPQVETDTTQTAQAQEQTTDTAGETQGVQEDKYVPYGRFKEVNEGLKAEREARAALEARLAELDGKVAKATTRPEEQAIQDQREQVRKALEPYIDEIARERGFLTKEEIQAQKDIEWVQTRRSELEKEWDGSNGKPKFDFDAVRSYAIENRINTKDPLKTAFYEMHEAEIDNWKIQTALTKTKGVKTESSNGSGSAQAGATTDDLLKAAKSGDKQAWHTFLKRTGQKS